ncbi:MAG: L-2-amino-thiazoline-4-carboxylic acid hydrolase [Candidatus Heimdallarchaeota archaeon]
MKAENLKNYGINMHDLSKTIPRKTWRMVQKITLSTIRKELGLLASLKLLFLIRKKIKEYSKINLNRIRTFCKNEEFIEEKIKDAATYAAIQELTSPSKAKEIYVTILDQVFPIIGEIIYPNPEVVSTIKDPFELIKEYVLAMLEADKEEGLHYFELIESTSNVLRFNVIHCAWYEIKKELGIPEATFQDCYADEASLPSMLEKIGMQFIRTKTIVEGSPYCDFCIKKIKSI